MSARTQTYLGLSHDTGGVPSSNVPGMSEALEVPLLVSVYACVKQQLRPPLVRQVRSSVRVILPRPTAAPPVA